MSDFCVFCAIASGDAPAFLVYEDENAVAFLDIAPVRRGHTLVAPRRHVADVMASGGAEAWSDVAVAVQTMSRMLMARLGSDGISLFQANRRAAGQEVWHLHVHLVPRREGDERLVRWRRSEVERVRLASTYGELQQHTP
jgi:histidine triad (HIT) family protein